MPFTPYRITLDTGDFDLPLVDLVGCLSFSAANELGWHSHDGYEVTMVLKGSVQWEIQGGDDHHLTRGLVSVIPPGVRHRAADGMTKPCDLVWAVFNPDMAEARRNTTLTMDALHLCQQILKRTGSRIGIANPTLFATATQLRSLLSTIHRSAHNDLLTISVLRSVLCQLIAQTTLCFSHDQYSLWSSDVNQAYDYIHTHFREDIDAKQIAAFIGKSEPALYKSFSKETGHTPNDLIRRLRVDYATQQLKTTKKSATEIAFAAGFSSSQYFSQVFRKYTGRSPLEYRADHKK